MNIKFQQSPSLYVAWTEFQRRQVSMADEAGFECIFLPISAGGRFQKLWGYISGFVSTVKMLYSRRPRVVWVQLPQVPVLWAVLTYQIIFRENIKIVADCHNAMFRAPWSRFPFGLSLFNRCDCVIVHNGMVRQQAVALGVESDRLLVLEDVPPVVDQTVMGKEPTFMAGFPRPWIVLPGSFSADEPISEVFQAAKLAPDITFVITGRFQNSTKNGHSIECVPDNVVMPGFIPLEQFDELLRHADIILGLTKVEGIQLSVCNEALGYGKALIVSNTELLVKLFGRGAYAVDSSRPEDIVCAVREVLKNMASYISSSKEHAKDRRSEWTRFQLSNVLERLRYS